MGIAIQRDTERLINSDRNIRMAGIQRHCGLRPKFGETYMERRTNRDRDIGQEIDTDKTY